MKLTLRDLASRILRSSPYSCQRSCLCLCRQDTDGRISRAAKKINQRRREKSDQLRSISNQNADKKLGAVASFTFTTLPSSVLLLPWVSALHSHWIGLCPLSSGSRSSGFLSDGPQRATRMGKVREKSETLILGAHPNSQNSGWDFARLQSLRLVLTCRSKGP